jgi:hypothetical protein
MFLHPLVVMEKKKEISFVSILLRDGLKMENISVSLVRFNLLLLCLID